MKRRRVIIKVLWHDGQGLCLFAKRLERGRFIWPSAAGGAVTITPAQLGYLLEGSTGGRRREPGGRRRQADCGILTRPPVEGSRGARFCGRLIGDERR